MGNGERRMERKENVQHLASSMQHTVKWRNWCWGWCNVLDWCTWQWLWVKWHKPSLLFLEHECSCPWSMVHGLRSMLYGPWPEWHDCRWKVPIVWPRDFDLAQMLLWWGTLKWLGLQMHLDECARHINLLPASDWTGPLLVCCFYCLCLCWPFCRPFCWPFKE